MNFSLDPVHGKRHQAHAAIRVVAFDRLHQADIAFLNQIGVRQTITQVTASNGYNQTQMRQDKLPRGFQVFFITKTNREIMFLLLAQHRKAVHCLNIVFQAAE